MAKRARGSITRPGQRARLQRSGPRPSESRGIASPKPPSLTPEEEARAAELEAQIVAESRAAEDSLRRSRDRGRREPDVAAPARPGSLTLQARDEYQYVARDIRRIVLIGGSLVLLLVALWVAMHVAGVTRL